MIKHHFSSAGTNSKISSILQSKAVHNLASTAASNLVIFVGGEEESIIEDISLTNMNITLCSQGTQKCGYFDELPSIRKVYPHSIPVIYGRFVDGLQVTGKVRYCQPYTPADNALSQTEQCKNVEILMKCQEK